MNDNSEKAENKSGGSSRLLIIILIIVIVVMGGLMAFILLRNDDDEEFSDEFFDPLAQTGLLPDLTESEIQSELNRVVEEGMLNISIAGAIPVTGTEARLNIQNSEANHYIIKVQITLDDTGEVIYESGGVKPGQYLRFVDLDRELSPGEYPATALFTAYTTEERQIAGTAAAEITLYVSD